MSFDENDFLEKMGTEYAEHYRTMSEIYDDEEDAVTNVEKEPLTEFFKKKYYETGSILSETGAIEEFSRDLISMDVLINNKLYREEELTDSKNLTDNSGVPFLTKDTIQMSSEKISTISTLQKEGQKKTATITVLAVLYFNTPNPDPNGSLIKDYCCSFGQQVAYDFCDDSVDGFPLRIQPAELRGSITVLKSSVDRDCFKDSFRDKFPQKHNLYVLSTPGRSLIVVQEYVYVVCVYKCVSLVSVWVTVIFNFTTNVIMSKYKYKWNPRYSTSDGKFFFKEFFNVLKEMYDDDKLKKGVLDICEKTFASLDELLLHDSTIKLELENSTNSDSLKNYLTRHLFETKQQLQPQLQPPGQQQLQQQLQPPGQQQLQQQLQPPGQPQESVVSTTTNGQPKNFLLDHKVAIGASLLTVGGIISAATLLGGQTKKIRSNSNKKKRKKKSTLNRGRKTYKKKRKNRVSLTRHKKTNC